MSRIIAALFLCLAFAPMARAQSFDCASASGVLQRVCAAPDLIPLEEERLQLIAEIQFFDPAHPAIQGEGAWLAAQESCADDACLSAAYGAHNQELRAALDAARPPEELVDEPEPIAPPTIAPRDGPASSLDDGPAVQPNEYLIGLGIVLVTFLIAFWLLTTAARARRRDRDA